MPLPVTALARRRAAWLALALTAAVPAPAPAQDAPPPVELRLRAAEDSAARGELRDAQAILEGALSGLPADAGPATRAAVLARLGGVLGEAGATDRAEELLVRAAADAAAAGLEPLRAEALNDLGNALLNADAARALAAYDEAGAAAAGSGLPSLAARASLNAARAELRRGDTAAAAARLGRAEALLAEAPGGAATLERLALAGAAVELARRDRAQLERAYRLATAAREAAASGADAGPRERSWAAGFLGELYAAEGRHADALALHRQASLLAEEARAPEVLFRWQWLSGRALAALGRRDEAIAAYRTAVRNLEEVRLDLPAFDPRTGRSLFRETLGPVFAELADLLLQRAGTDDPATAQVDLVEARGTIERLKTVELEDYFRDDCATDLTARARPLDKPGERTAVLYPVLLEKRTELVLSLPDGRLVSARTPVGAAEVTRQANAFRTALENPYGTAFLAPARALYDHVVRPVEALLDQNGVETLVFVPDGALRNIPLSALHDGERFLVERRAVATGLGLSLLDTRPLPRRDVSVLVAGLTQSVQGFVALPAVGREVAAIARTLPGSAVSLTDEEFTAPALQQSLARTPFTIVHLASHALFTGDPKNSFVLTWDGRLDMDELERLVKLSQFRDEPVELLTLSACQTAKGDDRSALGLAGVAVKVGARSALASLWDLEDEAAVALVSRFYANLLEPGVNRAEALRRAQLSLLAEPRTRRPFFWASFLLIGNWL